MICSKPNSASPSSIQIKSDFSKGECLVFFNIIIREIEKKEWDRKLGISILQKMDLYDVVGLMKYYISQQKKNNTSDEDIEQRLTFFFQCAKRKAAPANGYRKISLWKDAALRRKTPPQGIVTIEMVGKMEEEIPDQYRLFT